MSNICNHNHSAEETFAEHGIRMTAVRKLVWRAIHNFTHDAFSLLDIEAKMPHMDRSSIFRALRLFSEHHLLHEIDDGSGFQKYCLCRCDNGVHMGHVHFTCTECGHTFCLEDIAIPQISIPEEFEVEEMEFVVKGKCNKCRK